ncbi:phosphonate utilization associated putative membrane protein [Halomonas campaniensis]|uniref:Phosphonate utilization associated putative membrane protein n=1 Tax=Halomonas campaniensis TaxID=213554 RepID=A0A7W5K2N2_9GAMM|nr:EamA family transporter [Halomonas campaniensis]MBB3330822.1 phosphonate utilization associated putative membrane protein [Halomonas campaniensis]
MSASLALALSVTMHVIWNLMARHLPREANPLWWVLLAHLLLFAPWGFWELASRASWSLELVALLAVSATANAIYFLGLARAYEQAPVALVYPLVRSSPLLIALWGSLLLGQSLPLLAWVGIGVSVVGLWIMASTARHATDRRALPWALLAMLATSLYSLSDKAATPHLPTFMALVGFLSVGYLAAWLCLTWRMHGQTRRWRPPQRIGAVAGLVGGSCIGLAYALVIHAMRELPAAEVVAYTNAGIVFATLLSIFLFRERAAWRRRVLGMVVITLGLVILALR